MRFLHIIAILIIVIFSGTASWAKGTAYLNLEDDQIVSVFNKPGMNWKNCTRGSDCTAVGWPDNTATIKVISPVQKMKVVSPYTDIEQDEEYVQIEYSYERKVNNQTYFQTGKGWIDAAYVSEKRQNTFYGMGNKADSVEKDCPPVTKAHPGDLKEIKKTVTPLHKSSKNISVTETAKLLNPYVGACTIDPNPKKKLPETSIENPYDAYVLPTIKTTIPKVHKENGELMSKKDLIDIDAAARSIYAEMAQCYKYGLQYPMSVARIAVNRANSKNREDIFIKGTHNSSKGDLAKVFTSPSQFSLWLKKIKKKANGSLRQALCPPSKAGTRYWTGNLVPQFELDIWQNTLRIATEAVLFPMQFKARTNELKKDTFYSSGEKSFYDMKKANPPSIEGRKISRDSCIQIWRDTEPKKNVVNKANLVKQKRH